MIKSASCFIEYWKMARYEQKHMTRDRVHAQGTKDLFTECARADDKAIKRRLEGGVEETLADIPNFRLSWGGNWATFLTPLHHITIEILVDLGMCFTYMGDMVGMSNQI